MLQTSALRKTYGTVRALDGLTLSVEAGEITGLVGHNGAGKTTLVEIISGLTRPDGGEITIGGRNPHAARGNIGVAPQQIALYPAATVREHLNLFGTLAGLRRAALAAATAEVVEAMMLSSFMDRRVGLLSGGQQRRVQAGTALLHRPALLVLDEPTAGADPETRQSLLDVVRRHARDGAAVLYITHYLPELTELDATIAVVQHGRVIARGTSDELLGDLPGDVCVQFENEEVRISTGDPATALVTLLSHSRGPVRDIHLRRPSLDDLYRSLS